MFILSTSEALRVLGLSPDFTEDQLKKAYKTLARKYHPDVAGVGSTDKFKEVKQAYDLLSTSGSNGAKNVFTHQSIFTVVKQR